MMIRDGAVSIIGSDDVSDYLDFIIAEGKEQDFFTAIADYLKEKGITGLNLESLRPDSRILNGVTDAALISGCEVTFKPADVSLEMKLPDTWDEYMMTLNTKQRHEVRRKLRRLEEAGSVEYRSLGDPGEVRESLDIFLKMFTESRDDKADYLTEKREKFFRSMTEAMTDAGLLRLGILDIESVPAAIIMYFDYNDNIYLYNSGYESAYNSLSVGLLSKMMCIRESIEAGKKVFDFLKGDEVYKYRLGGTEVPLVNCQIKLK
jgi:CelD/BcsL family acetyltransferase involved in cellulose biosynthesis